MALMLFLICNPMGNIPVFVSLVKDFDFRRQRLILFREALISMALAYFFLVLGESFLNVIVIQQYSVSLAGGVLVFLISLNMIFPPQPCEGSGSAGALREPFVVPIATPLLSGGGVFATVMVLAKQAPLANVGLAIFVAWIPTLLIVPASVYLQKIVGRRGLIVMEQLMGMVLAILAIKLLVLGLHAFAAQAHIPHSTTLTS
jgi:multiple antibiotic resistance protein